MRKYVVIIGAMVLTGGTVAAQQEVPRYGGLLGYNYTRFSDSSNSPPFSTNGGNGQVIYNFVIFVWLNSLVYVEFTTKGNMMRVGVDRTFVNYIAGPRFNIRRWKRFSPYIQALFSGATAFTTTPVTGVIVPPTTPGGPLVPACAGCEPTPPPFLVTSRVHHT